MLVLFAIIVSILVLLTLQLPVDMKAVYLILLYQFFTNINTNITPRGASALTTYDLRFQAQISKKSTNFSVSLVKMSVLSIFSRVEVFSVSNTAKETPPYINVLYTPAHQPVMMYFPNIFHHYLFLANIHEHDISSYSYIIYYVYSYAFVQSKVVNKKFATM